MKTTNGPTGPVRTKGHVLLATKWPRATRQARLYRMTSCLFNLCTRDEDTQFLQLERRKYITPEKYYKTSVSVDVTIIFTIV